MVAELEQELIRFPLDDVEYESLGTALRKMDQGCFKQLWGVITVAASFIGQQPF
jgi:hypothetical protein